MGRPAGAGGHHVAVEMHRGLGRAGGARGEGHQADVVGRGEQRLEVVGPARRAGLQRVVGAAVEQHHLAQAGRAAVGAGQRQLLGQPGVAQGVADLGLVDDLPQFLGPQQRHRADRDAAGLDDRQPAGGQHRRVGTAQQHPVATDQAQALDQLVGNAVHLGLQLGIGPAHALALDGEALAFARGHPGVEQRRDTVQPLGELQLRQVEHQLGPLVGWRQAVAGESVGQGAGKQGHGRALPRRADQNLGPITSLVNYSGLYFSRTPPHRPKR
jgi:hypothetical protein